MTEEELEKATGKELIEQRDYCGVDGYYGDYLDNVNAEMLKRFNRLADLEKENAELRKSCDETQELLDKQIEATYNLDKENAELKETVIKMNKVITETFSNLTKAKELLKKLKALYFSPVVTKDDVKRQDEILVEVEQFLSEEVEK